MSYDFILDKPQSWNSNPEALAFPYFSTWPKSLKQHPQGKAVYGAQRGPWFPTAPVTAGGGRWNREMEAAGYFQKQFD